MIVVWKWTFVNDTPWHILYTTLCTTYQYIWYSDRCIYMCYGICIRHINKTVLSCCLYQSTSRWGNKSITVTNAYVFFFFCCCKIIPIFVFSACVVDIQIHSNCAAYVINARKTHYTPLLFILWTVYRLQSRPTKRSFLRFLAINGLENRKQIHIFFSVAILCSHFAKTNTPFDILVCWRLILAKTKWAHVSSAHFYCLH